MIADMDVVILLMNIMTNFMLDESEEVDHVQQFCLVVRLLSVFPRKRNYIS